MTTKTAHWTRMLVKLKACPEAVAWAKMNGAPGWDGWEYELPDLAALLARVADEERSQERVRIVREMGHLADPPLDPVEYFGREFKRAGEVGYKQGVLAERERAANAAESNEGRHGEVRCPDFRWKQMSEAAERFLVEGWRVGGSLEALLRDFYNAGKIDAGAAIRAGKEEA